MALWTRCSSPTDEDDFFGTVDDDGIPDRHSRCLDGHHHHLLEGLAAKESAAVEQQHRTLGYHETYESSQEATLQDGFAAGYCETFESATRIGNLLGQAAASRLLRQKIQVGNTSEGSAQNDASYLAAAFRIRNVLKNTTSAQDPVISEVDGSCDSDAADTVKQEQQHQHVLEDLEREVEGLLNIDSGKDLSINESC